LWGPARRTALKRSVRSALRAAGLEISRAHATVGTLPALAWLLGERDVAAVLDVGANAGEFAESLRRAGFDRQIVSFEPRREAFMQLEARAARDPRWTARCVALGATDAEVIVNVAANRVSSSILDMERAHIDAAPGARYVSTERVRQARLDDVVTEIVPASDVLAIKIDVQGYEGAVLEGAPSTLERAAALHLELSLDAVYRGQPDWRGLIDDLGRRGFALYALEPVFCHPVTGQTLQIDAVFRRRD
jgi:FkbM family methyltransferase